MLEEYEPSLLQQFFNYTLHCSIRYLLRRYIIHNVRN